MSVPEDWLAAEARYAAGAMMEAISARHRVMERPGFAQRVVPRAGSVLASPVVAHYDPAPDYFFHWFRDSAIVIDALRAALVAGYLGERGGETALVRLREFVEFSLALRSIDGPRFLRDSHLGERVRPDHLQYLRPEAEMAALGGTQIATDVRVNADGTPDFLRWGRPQMDGPALRCLALLRWLTLLRQREELSHSRRSLEAPIGELIEGDLGLTVEHADERCFDIWEEHCDHHYYTQLVQSEALKQGGAWLSGRGDSARARECESAGARVDARLERLWSEPGDFYRASAGDAGDAGDARDHPDSAVILGVLHAGRGSGRHSVLDARARSTLATLETLFEREFAINRDLPPERGPAMGRYPNDRYYGGGAWYVVTLAAAEFYFRLASALGPGSQAALAVQRGDTFLRTVQAFTPASGELSEQFDRTTGAQTSARHLSWSYAALITAAAARAPATRAIAA